MLDQLVDLGDVAVGGALELLLGAADLVLARLAVLAMRCSSSIALRRMLRMVTLASSPLPRATLTISRRRSSDSCGMTTRMILPSLLGFSPRSESRIAFSIAPSWLAS